MNSTEPISYAKAMAPIVEQIDNSTVSAFKNLTAGLPTVTQMSTGAYRFLGGADNAITKTVTGFGNTSMNLVANATSASNATVNTLGNQAVSNYQILANNSGKQKK